MLGGELPAARLTAAGFVEAKHPRQPKGSDRGGEFAPKSGGVTRQVVRGKPVYTAQLSEAQRKANLDALKAAKTRPVEGVTRLTIPGGVTTQEIPRQWLVDQGYAIPSTRGRLYGGDGVIQLKRDVDQEAILVHYLSGQRPENYPVGSKGFDQFMFGRQLPAGSSKEAREAVRKLRAKNKGERAAIVQRITAALVAAGIEEMEAHALVAAAFAEEKHPRQPKGSERGGEFARKGTAARETPERTAAREAAHAKAERERKAFELYEKANPKKAPSRQQKPPSAPGRTWAEHSTMGELEDMMRENPSDEELGKRVRRFYLAQAESMRKSGGGV